MAFYAKMREREREGERDGGREREGEREGERERGVERARLSGHRMNCHLLLFRRAERSWLPELVLQTSLTSS